MQRLSGFSGLYPVGAFPRKPEYQEKTALPFPRHLDVMAASGACHKTGTAPAYPRYRGTVIGFDPCTAASLGNRASFRPSGYLLRVEALSGSPAAVDTVTTYNLPGYLFSFPAEAFESAGGGFFSSAYQESYTLDFSCEPVAAADELHSVCVAYILLNSVVGRRQVSITHVYDAHTNR